MSEVITKHAEQRQESLDDSTLERPKAIEFSAAEQDRQIKKAQEAVIAEAGSIEQTALPPEPVDDRPNLIDPSVKSHRMRLAISKTQTKLSPAQRGFSKVIHQPLVQKVSESTSRTVARPSGLLGGGLTAFIGTLGYQVLTRYYGLPYNFSFFLVFFIGGFGLGLALEYLLRRLRRD